MNGLLGLGEFLVEFGRKDGVQFLVLYSHFVQIDATAPFEKRTCETVGLWLGLAYLVRRLRD